MSIYIRPNLYVTIKQLETDHAPRPLPLESGFQENKAYEILGVHAPSESAEAWLILKNDRDEMWFIANRHCRLVEEPALRQGGCRESPEAVLGNAVEFPIGSIGRESIGREEVRASLTGEGPE